MVLDDLVGKVERGKEFYSMLQKVDKNEKQMLISLLNKDIIVDGRTNTMINAIKIYCKSIFSAIEENDISLIKFPTMNYEL